ncbi:hypothetical protein [Kingella sp. (in: b-proteobacteria)]|uniref:hypothetical protein n=1 Tax=Kingella sp. (in: b-proteobacteria) TaxID=2020713 RepID=UPI0026DD9079|nr:hypothetical protein [Kingella sp. (in: b-proteobacteria)]MDO4657793.1 hypothetical protein [Kingella sp. (in: b-proteobacteria)]
MGRWWFADILPTSASLFIHLSRIQHGILTISRCRSILNFSGFLWAMMYRQKLLLSQQQPEK